MSRLWQSGFELNSLTANVEVTANSNMNINTSRPRSGAYAVEKGVASSAEIDYTFVSANSQADYYLRGYFVFTGFPAVTTDIMGLANNLSATKMNIRITSSGTLQLYNNEDSAQVGSNSGALTLGVRYAIEIRVNTTTLASTVVDALIDSVSFASGTVNITTGIQKLYVGNFSGAGAAALLFVADDIAINNSSGSFQNSYPGQGKIIHLRPNAAGDNTAWTGAYTDVDEVTPDDATTVISSNTLDQIEDMNIDSPSMMGDQDTVNVVAVGVRFNGVGGSANASFVLRIKASASGTVEESSAITPSNTTYVTNAAAAPRNYSLVLYDLPGASTTAWTKNDLEQAQIGVRLSATSTNAAQVSTLWASVDYTPVFGPMKQKPRNPKINWRI